MKNAFPELENKAKKEFDASISAHARTQAAAWVHCMCGNAWIELFLQFVFHLRRGKRFSRFGKMQMRTLLLTLTLLTLILMILIIHSLRALRRAKGGLFFFVI